MPNKAHIKQTMYETKDTVKNTPDANLECVISYICFLAVVRNVHCLFYMGLVWHSKTNLETRIPDFCLMGAKYFLH